MSEQITQRVHKMTDKSLIFAPFKMTKEQHAWLIKESEATGSNKTAIVRGLIQAEVVKEKMK